MNKNKNKNFFFQRKGFNCCSKFFEYKSKFLTRVDKSLTDFSISSIC